MQRSRVNKPSAININNNTNTIFPPNFEITIWFERCGNPKYMNLPLLSFSLPFSFSLFLSLIPSGESQISLVLVTQRGGERRSSSFQHESSIIYEKHKFLAWIQAKTIHQSINPQSWVELVGEQGENIRAPILWFESSSASSFSVSSSQKNCRRKKEETKTRFQFNKTLRINETNERQMDYVITPLCRYM